jgi:hypothetical protein
VNDTVAESVLVEKLELGTRVGGQRGFPPPEDDRPDEQLELVDQPGHESLCCEVRATHDEIRVGGGLEVVDCLRVELAFKAGVRG